MTTSWPPGESDDDSASAASPSSTPLADAPESDVTDVGPEPSDQLSNAHPEPGQPGFQYDQEQPSPPQNITKTVTPAPTQAAPAPPTPPSQDTSNSGTGLDGSGPDGGDGNTQPPPQPQDSLSLAQLRRVLAEFPRTEPVAYDYVYTDTGPIEEEVDEWFTYHFWQWVRLNTAHRAFESAWNASAPDAAFHAGAAEVQRWEEADEDLRRSFVRQLLGGIKPADRSRPRSEAIGALVYLVLGRWEETLAGATLPSPADPKVRSMATRAQLDAMKAGVLLLAECDGLPIIWEALTSTSDLFWDHGIPQIPPNLQQVTEDLINFMTIMYIAMQVALEDPIGLASVKSKLRALNPSLVGFWFHAVATNFRWDETGAISQKLLFLSFWKSILVVFGGTREIAETKHATSEDEVDSKDKDLITASPLDYHMFRQEITSKYPAYMPPQPVIPLEAENTSLLPHLPNQLRVMVSNGILPPPNQSGGASILHQPVHIATPAPSPPPSPGVGGKGGKKQNYQTNQNFPFMYPPLDATSNNAGGKGGAGLQGALVGRRWEGSDIPASILEAGELFSRRVRMTRATRQLWEEREKFLKFDRGWEEPDEDFMDGLDLSDLTVEEREELGLVKADKKKQEESMDGQRVDYGPRDASLRVKERLDAVEIFYEEALPHLQSLVIVTIRAIAIIGSSMAPPTASVPPGGPNNARPNGGPNGGGPAPRGQEGPNGESGVERAEAASPTDEEIEDMRNKEITGKAITASLILLLKWFKISHVLKFEFFTQLLLDAGFLTFVLKIFAMHDVQHVVENRTDRIEESFFYFCGSRAGAIPYVQVATTEFEEDSEDDAAPPPIRRRRSPQSQGDKAGGEAAGSQQQPPSRPEVDEMGCPSKPVPKEQPITEFSRRNFFALINYLRVLQKICKNKAHRNLLLVHYKSSNILRKALKVPQHELRLYTLKLFKNQVPYCGRKWRQSNMRVITAVYLHCRPELRDEWLAGSDVDAEVEEALPLEQALRSLTHWFNVRRYPDRMSPEVRAALREEQDFFVRELEKMDLNWADIEGDDASVRLEWEQDGGVWG